MAELGLWDEIKNTRTPDEEERFMSRRFPFGVLRRLDIHWTAQGEGESGARYALSATEHQPQGLVAQMLEPLPSMTAVVARFSPVGEACTPRLTTYLAQLAAGEPLSVEAGIRSVDDLEEGQFPEPVWTPPKLALFDEDAFDGLRRALADANFA